MVSQASGRPASIPALNHCMRSAEEPWVKASGATA